LSCHILFIGYEHRQDEGDPIGDNSNIYLFSLYPPVISYTCKMMMVNAGVDGFYDSLAPLTRTNVSHQSEHISRVQGIYIINKP
jgi:hypothetical protein